MTKTEASTFEPPQGKTNKMACVPREDSDQPGHPPSLIRVFAVHMKKVWVFSYPLMPRLIRVFAGPKGHFVGFVMRWLILYESALRYCQDSGKYA